jgi:hypothetical protein
MLHRSVLAFLFAALAAIPALSRAGDTQWEIIRVYALAEGRSLAVAAPSEWEPVGEVHTLGTNSTLRFLDEAGNRIEIPVAALLRASAGRRVLPSEDTRKLATKVRNWS